MSVVAVSLAMVMAGTGELDVFRRFRFMHGHYGDGVQYGHHLATHMAIGLLFLGRGRFTLGNSDAAVTALLIAFYPVYPAQPYENRIHLQAYRHLWVMAVEPRCIFARDVDSDESIFLPIKLRVVEGDNVRGTQLIAPTLIPSLSSVESIVVDSARYWPVALHLKTNADHLAGFLRTGTIYVKRKTGHYSYAQDPKGFRNVFTRSGSEAGNLVVDFGEVSHTLVSAGADVHEFMSSFGRRPEFGAAAVHLLGSSDREPSEYEAFSSAVLLECLTRDKADLIPVYHSLFAAQAAITAGSVRRDALVGLDQLLFVAAFYAGGHFRSVFARDGRIHEQLLQKALVAHLERKLERAAGESCTDAVRRYLRDPGVWPADDGASTVARYLGIHRAPAMARLEELRDLVAETREASAPAGAQDEVARAVELVLRSTRRTLIRWGEPTWTLALHNEMTAVWL